MTTTKYKVQSKYKNKEIETKRCPGVLWAYMFGENDDAAQVVDVVPTYDDELHTNARISAMLPLMQLSDTAKSLCPLLRIYNYS